MTIYTPQGEHHLHVRLRKFDPLTREAELHKSRKSCPPYTEKKGTNSMTNKITDLKFLLGGLEDPQVHYPGVPPISLEEVEPKDIRLIDPSETQYIF